MKKILDTITSLSDLRSLSLDDKKELALELREELLNDVSKTGGHLASNLGVVELTIAIHSVFNTPFDKVVWDVGHQTYIHKILTGRRDKMATLREIDGLSGFPKRRESEYDSFDTGHSSTSISVALGMARARDLKKEKNRIVAVIGDGALTGGMSYEALADAASSKTNIIVILNDNEMSIDKSSGGLATALSKARTKPLYTNSNQYIKGLVLKIPKLGPLIVKIVRRIKHILKQIFIPNMLFEDMGFTYLGPVDGHDIDKLEAMLYRARDLKGPVLIHCLTKKGKGYKYAEENPDLYHGVSAFDIEKGIAIKESLDYSAVFGNKLEEIAKKNDKVVAITAAMTSGTGLTKFKNTYPERLFDVEIAEQHAFSLAGGLAVSGMIPVIAVYSSFAQRAYDQLIHDIALQELHVVICLDRAGIVGKDGETHQGLFDLAFTRAVPNLIIMAPKDFKELEDMLEVSINDFDMPVVIRYPRGKETMSFENSETQLNDIKAKKAEVLKDGNDLTIIAIGKMVAYAIKVSELLKERGIEAKVINNRFLKPLDEKTLLSQINDRVVTIEDASIIGGLAEAIDSLFEKANKNVDILHFAYPDEFIKQGETSDIEKRYGLDVDSMTDAIFAKWFKKDIL